MGPRQITVYTIGGTQGGKDHSIQFQIPPWYRHLHGRLLNKWSKHDSSGEPVLSELASWTQDLFQNTVRWLAPGKPQSQNTSGRKETQDSGQAREETERELFQSGRKGPQEPQSTAQQM